MTNSPCFEKSFVLGCNNGWSSWLMSKLLQLVLVDWFFFDSDSDRSTFVLSLIPVTTTHIWVRTLLWWQTIFMWLFSLTVRFIFCFKDVLLCCWKFYLLKNYLSHISQFLHCKFALLVNLVNFLWSGEF